jgi:hypothetical protein
MKKHLTLSLAVALMILPLLPATAPGEEGEQEQLPEGQTAFIKAKCNLCHTVVAAGIGEPREESEEESDIVLPPDLSTVGSLREAEWLTLYLQKKETLGDEKHVKKFKGEDEDLAAIIGWLMTMKAPGDTLAAEPEAEEVPAEETPTEEAPSGEAPAEETD